MSDPSLTLVILDGDLAGFVALANASDARPAAAGSRRLAVWPIAAQPGEAVAWLSIEKQAALYGAEILRSTPALPIETEAVMAAARWTAQQGGRTVFWPAHPGIPGAPDSVDVDRAGQIAEKALLIERLVSLEYPSSPVVEANLADLTDRQVADLVLDLGLPIGLAWWSDGATPVASAASDRWSRVFETVGYSMNLVTEPKLPPGRTVAPRRR